MNTKDRKIAELEEDVAKLRYELDELRSAVKPAAGFAGFPHLSKAETALLTLLARYGQRTHAQLYSALYFEAAEVPEPQIVKVHIHRLRTKLAPFGVKIHCVWGVGYELPPQSLSIVRNSMVAFAQSHAATRAWAYPPEAA